MSLKVFDFFSGCGGTSSGLESVGFDIAMGLDFDKDAVDSFKANFPKAQTVCAPIETLSPDILTSIIGDDRENLLFCGCAPCQPFSKQNRQKSSNDPRKNLLVEFSRFVEYWTPSYILIENVPGIQKLTSKGPFHNFLVLLSKLGYHHDYDVLPASNYGVPQRRERLVLIASNKAPIALPAPSHGPESSTPYSCVEDWIRELPPIAAGETCEKDSQHQAAKLSPKNLERIKATPEGGTRENWPEELKLECHKNYSGHSDVYGRLHWKKLASGLTTRCISLSNGRFGHPSQNRALSIREAANLQTFPPNYRFYGSLSSRARQIGNAVPPLMAQKLGTTIKMHYQNV